KGRGRTLKHRTGPCHGGLRMVGGGPEGVGVIHARQAAQIPRFITDRDSLGFPIPKTLVYPFHTTYSIWRMEKVVAPSGAATSRPAPRRGRPPRLSAEEIVDVALALLRAEGMRAVTFRRLAEELGVTPMSLYSYFGSKDELLGAMTARVIQAPAESFDTTLPW